MIELYFILLVNHNANREEEKEGKTTLFSMEKLKYSRENTNESHEYRHFICILYNISLCTI